MKPQATGLVLFLFLCTFIAYQSSRENQKLAMSSQDSIRFVILSDTHRSYEHPIPHGDVLIHAGDSELSASEMDNWATSHPHSHKIAVCGNMDSRLHRGKQELRNVTYLQDSEISISGLKIYGSPWTPEFVGIFQLGDQDEAKAVWERVPTDVDVLVSHGPPKGILDRTSRGIKVGDEALLDMVESIKPRVHCFGHVHESYGTLKTDHTIFCNAAVFNGYAPIVVDVPLDRTKPATLA